MGRGPNTFVHLSAGRGMIKLRKMGRKTKERKKDRVTLYMGENKVSLTVSQ